VIFEFQAFMMWFAYRPFALLRFAMVGAVCVGFNVCRSQDHNAPSHSGSLFRAVHEKNFRDRV
jgi:hypothetical protein